MAALKRLHYGWVVVVAGMLTVFASIGFGRFALGMLLPSMGVSLSLTYAEMGLISTGNLVGYLVAVYGVRFLVRRIGARWTVTGGLVLVGVSMIVVGRAIGFADSLVLYTLTGLGSGIANVPVMGLVSLWFARQQRGKAAGLMVIGNGLAIAAAGLLVPAVSAALGAEGWRTSWLILALAVLAVALVCGVILRNHPATDRLWAGLLTGALRGDERTSSNTVTTVEKPQAMLVPRATSTSIFAPPPRSAFQAPS